MSRSGRRRKDGPRKPSGDLRVPRAERERDVVAVALAQPHRTTLPPEQRRDARAECELGMLAIIGPDWGGIDATQYQAGVQWRALVRRYQRVISAPRGSPGSLADMVAIPPDVHGAEVDEASARAIRERYNDAFEALAGDRRALHAVNDVAVWDRPFSVRPDRVGALARGTVDDLRRGLNRVARHFGLDGRRKSL